MCEKSLVPEILEYKVSSVLNADRKVYGKKFLFDGKDETCWNSDQGLPQWIHLKFEEPKTIKVVKIQFQGGFAGKECNLEVINETPGAKSETEKFQFAPDDSNKLQMFTLPTGLTSQAFRVNFQSTTDFYGRIIVYNFDILGS